MPSHVEHETRKTAKTTLPIVVQGPGEITINKASGGAAPVAIATVSIAAGEKFVGTIRLYGEIVTG